MFLRSAFLPHLWGIDSVRRGVSEHVRKEDAYVVAVVVTHDRRDLLAEALTAIGAQTRVPDVVVVVDNASSDGTAELLESRFPGVDLVRLPYNTGGAGGFAAGIRSALLGLTGSARKLLVL